MAYRPELGKTVVLPTGTPLHAYFDHPNHSGFTPQDHAAAAHWHNEQAAEHERFNETPKAEFHRAQGILHARAAQGQATKPRSVPSDAVLSTLTPERKKFWLNQSEKIQEDNAELHQLDQYRMANVLSKSADPMAKTKQLLDLVKRPNKPAQDLTKPNDLDMIKEAIRRRRAERGGSGSESGDDQSSPAPALDEDQQAKIREAIANARARRGS